MASTYESAHLVESDFGIDGIAAPTRRAWPLRRIGVLVAATAAIGAVVAAVTSARQPISALKHMQVFHKGLVKAFSARSLAETADFTGKFEFLFAEEGQEDLNGLSMKIFMAKDEEQEGQEVAIVFEALEGKGEDLVNQLNKVVEAVAEGRGDEFKENIRVELGDAEHPDRAVVTITVPEGEADEEEEAAETEIGESMQEPPDLTATLTFGRTIKEMYDNADDNIAKLTRGVKLNIDAVFAHSMLTGLQDAAKAEGVALPPVMGIDEAKIMAALSSESYKAEIRYKPDGERFEAAFGHLPNLHQAVQRASAKLKALLQPAETLAISGLAEFADGVSSIEYRGLPHGNVLRAEIQHFHPTLLLKEILDDAEEGGDSGEDAEEGAPPEPEAGDEDTEGESPEPEAGDEDMEGEEGQEPEAGRK